VVPCGTPERSEKINRFDSERELWGFGDLDQNG
jgi:hypothetical protein